MKKAVSILLASVFLASGQAHAAGNNCRPLSGYRVSSVSFDGATLGEALTKIFDKTPIQHLTSASVPPISAKNLAGTVESVLDALFAKLDGVSYSYAKNECMVYVHSGKSLTDSETIHSGQNSNIDDAERRQAMQQIRSDRNSRNEHSAFRQATSQRAMPTETLMEFGERPRGSERIIEGRGEAMAFSMILSSLIPKSMSVYTDNDVDMRTPVSWRGDRDWIAIFRDMLASAGFSAEIDWGRNSIVLKKSAVSPQTASAISPAAPVVTGGGTWKLVTGKPIHLQLTEWASAAGWGFAWRPGKSWLVPAEVEFNGSFDKAIESVIEMLHAQGKPVRLALWEGNRFAEVTDVNVK